MDDIHSLRDSNSADVAVLVIDDCSSCGLASSIGSSASTAFADVHYDCATGYYLFGHEIGHLQSARHDPDTDSSSTPYTYGLGYRNNVAGSRTIMAYACLGGCTRLNYWSNPGKPYGGAVVGTTNLNDNHRVLECHPQCGNRVPLRKLISLRETTELSDSVVICVDEPTPTRPHAQP